MITLTITFDPTTGQIQANGPLEQKMLCYGMLDMARDLVRDYRPQIGGLTIPSALQPRSQSGHPNGSKN